MQLASYIFQLRFYLKAVLTPIKISYSSSDRTPAINKSPPSLKRPHGKSGVVYHRSKQRTNISRIQLTYCFVFIFPFQTINKLELYRELPENRIKFISSVIVKDRNSPVLSPIGYAEESIY